MFFCTFFCYSMWYWSRRAAILRVVQMDTCKCTRSFWNGNWSRLEVEHPQGQQQGKIGQILGELKLDKILAALEKCIFLRIVHILLYSLYLMNRLSRFRFHCIECISKRSKSESEFFGVFIHILIDPKSTM